jgi:hypothetical protein
MLGFQRAPKDFETWLACATRGLCDHSREFAGAEFEDHYAAACEDLERQGLTEAEVTTRALSGLGDPRKLRRRLRKIYLTTNDECRLTKVSNYLAHSAPPPIRKMPPLSWSQWIDISLVVAFPFLVAIGVFGALFATGNAEIADILLDVLFFILASVVVAIVLPAGVVLLLERAVRNPAPTLEAYLKPQVKVRMALGFIVIIHVLFAIKFGDVTMACVLFVSGLCCAVATLLVPDLGSKLERYPSRNQSPVVIEARQKYQQWLGEEGVPVSDNDTPRPA